MFEGIPRFKVASLPTPLHPLRNLGSSLDLTNLWIKRDDMTGIAFGGNKARKLEFVIGDALEKESDTVVTAGAVQSNHCRQTAAVAAQAGLRCILLLAGEEPERDTGNLLLDKLFGAEIKFFPDDSFMDLNDRMASVMTTLEELGLKPYGIPPGAFMPVGCLGYISAMQELSEQCEETGFYPERILVPTGTGGTLAGMIIGAELAKIQADIIGVSVLFEADELRTRVKEMIGRVFEEYPSYVDPFSPDFQVDDRFIEDGYGVVTDGVKSAIKMFAKMDAIILDPTYTAKAGLTLMRMALGGEIERNTRVLFWHTGGSPTFFNLGDSIFED